MLSAIIILLKGTGGIIPFYLMAIGGMQLAEYFMWSGLNFTGNIIAILSLLMHTMLLPIYLGKLNRVHLIPLALSVYVIHKYLKNPQPSSGEENKTNLEWGFLKNFDKPTKIIMGLVFAGMFVYNNNLCFNNTPLYSILLLFMAMLYNQSIDPLKYGSVWCFTSVILLSLYGLLY
tara:strand:+ start:1173 stop:1697 length:525 start_codon:yes stop_codon:yes gene_type:complete